jgi:hypothetical protein
MITHQTMRRELNIAFLPIKLMEKRRYCILLSIQQTCSSDASQCLPLNSPGDEMFHRALSQNINYIKKSQEETKDQLLRKKSLCGRITEAHPCIRIIFKEEFYLLKYSVVQFVKVN